jgi:hypothetical protein
LVVAQDQMYGQDPLQETLRRMFHETILNPQVLHRLEQTVPLLPSSQLDPSVSMELVKGLYYLDRNFATLNTQLFALYIPGIICTKVCLVSLLLLLLLLIVSLYT